VVFDSSAKDLGQHSSRQRSDEKERDVSEPLDVVDMLTEADTCRKYVLPALYAAGWNDDQISEQKSFTDGRIIVTGATARRGPQKRAGHLLRDVINKVNGIHFTSTQEIFTLGHLYESILKEMRDAAGENGEFYTPRPVVQFIAAAADPRLGETVLDPASGRADSWPPRSST
jgi:hypothetical protein